jgi:hypothetical protein
VEGYRPNGSFPWLRIKIALRNGSASEGLHRFFEPFRFGRTITLVINLTSAMSIPSINVSPFFPAQLSGPYLRMLNRIVETIIRVAERDRRPAPH